MILIIESDSTKGAKYKENLLRGSKLDPDSVQIVTTLEAALRAIKQTTPEKVVVNGVVHANTELPEILYRKSQPARRARASR